jgi:adenylate kinase family enzyme
VHRSDDTAEKLQSRLQEFHSKTVPVLHYYGSKVLHVPADQPMDLITNQIRKGLSK